MRHRKRTVKLGRTTSHRRALFANQLKSLIEHGRIVTTPAKAKQLRRHADQMITLAKEGTLSARRKVVAELSLRYNKLTPKEQRAAKTGNLSAYNGDRKILNRLFSELGPKFEERNGGYTRIVRLNPRRGDQSEQCLIEYIEN